MQITQSIAIPERYTMLAAEVEKKKLRERGGEYKNKQKEKEEGDEEKK